MSTLWRRYYCCRRPFYSICTAIHLTFIHCQPVCMDESVAAVQSRYTQMLLHLTALEHTIMLTVHLLPKPPCAPQSHVLFFFLFLLRMCTLLKWNATRHRSQRNHSLKKSHYPISVHKHLQPVNQEWCQHQQILYHLKYVLIFSIVDIHLLVVPFIFLIDHNECIKCHILLFLVTRGRGKIAFEKGEILGMRGNIYL